MNERKEKAERVLSEADDRDQQADARDTRANKRDMNANLESWLNQDDPSDVHYDTRQAAAQDRSASKADRTSAAEDRTDLAEDAASRPDADDSQGPASG